MCPTTDTTVTPVGVDLSFTLYTPPGYQEGTRVPTILYAYPLDYADASTAGQVTGSQQTFTQLYEYRLLLLGGYAIIDHTSFPIIGDPKKAYDTYFPTEEERANAALIGVDVRRIKLWIRGVTPEPFGIRATEIERDEQGLWRLRLD